MGARAPCLFLSEHFVGFSIDIHQNASSQAKLLALRVTLQQKWLFVMSVAGNHKTTNNRKIITIDLLGFNVYLPTTQTTREFKSFVMLISLHFDITKEFSRDCELGNLHTKLRRSIPCQICHKIRNQIF